MTGDLVVDASAPLDDATRGTIDHFFYELMVRRYGSPAGTYMGNSYGSGGDLAGSYGSSDAETGLARIANLL